MWDYRCALDTSIALPVATLFEAIWRTDKTKRPLAILAAVHTVAVTLAVFAWMWTWIAGVAATAVVVLIAAFSTTKIGAGTGAASASVMLSPLSYATAWPLWFERGLTARLAAFFIVGAHVVTAGGIMVLITASELHEAWGCYAPSAPIRDYELGMCGKNPKWYPPAAEVCETPPASSNDCNANLTPYMFFGRTLHFVTHAQTIAAALWIAEIAGRVRAPRSTVAAAAAVPNDTSFL